MRSFQQILAVVQSFVLVLVSSQVVWATEPVNTTPRAPSTPVQDQKQMFMTTQPVQTEAGPVHLEVTAFNIQNERDLQTARETIVGQFRYRPETNEIFRLNVSSKGMPVNNQLAIKTEAVIGEVESLVDARERLEQKNIEVEKPQQTFLKRHYNLTLAMVRFVANTGVVSVGLITGKGVPLEHALMIGALAGAISGGIQIKSAQVFAWLSNSVALVNSAKRIGLISNTNGLSPARSERILREVETYSKWAMLETGFLLACHTAMGLLSIPVTESLFETVAKSTLSQGVFEVGVLKAADQLEKMNPRWSNRAAVFKNVSIFAGSSISVLAAIGSMVGMPYSNLGFVVLTATGLVLNFSSKIVMSDSGQRLLTKWKARVNPASRVKSCRQLVLSAVNQ
jgi:hypothetical protein